MYIDIFLVVIGALLGAGASGLVARKLDTERQKFMAQQGEQQDIFRKALHDERAALQMRDQVHGWSRDLRSWAWCVQAVLVEARHLRQDGAERQSRRDCLLRLSILTEQGRLIFPNIARDRHGLHKEPARRGYRSAVLDVLVAATKILVREPGACRDEKARLEQLSNAFLSFVDVTLNPHSFNRNMVDMMQKTGERETDDYAAFTLDPERLAEKFEPPGEGYWLQLHESESGFDALLQRYKRGQDDPETKAEH